MNSQNFILRGEVRDASRTGICSEKADAVDSRSLALATTRRARNPDQLNMVDSPDSQLWRERPSTRVSAAPGGASTICLGSDLPDMKPTAVTQKANACASSAALPEDAAPTDGTTTGDRTPTGSPTSECDKQHEKTATSEPTAHRASVRIRQPPGGASSITLG